MKISNLIMNQLFRWKALPIQTLKESLGVSNYSSLMSSLYGLKKNGDLNIKPMKSIQRHKMVYPSKSAVKYSELTETLNIEENLLEHDALVSSLCLALEKEIPLVKEVLIEDFLFGEKIFRNQGSVYPDALMTLNTKKGEFKFPIELERIQKSQSRVKEKFYEYSEFSYYRDILFCFTQKRVAEKYVEIFKEFKDSQPHDTSAKFIFAWAPPEDFISGELDKFQLVYPQKKQNLRSLFHELI